jgi:hypothetical protein
MQKKGHQVVAEIHMWTRGKPDANATEAYSDNVKDPGDESLLAVAVQALGKLTGTVLGGTAVIHAGTGAGAVFVDGTQAGALEGGIAKLDVAQGAHVFEVRVPRFQVASQNATVPLAASADVSFTLTPLCTEETSGLEPSGGGVTARKAIEFTLMGLGAAGLVVSAVEWVRFQAQQSDATSDQTLRSIPSNQTNATYCPSNPHLDACVKYNDALSTRAIAWITFGAGSALAATGLVLWVTDHPGDEPKSAPPAAARVRVLPQTSSTSTGVQVVGSF